jgi:hypothetical protein
MPATQVARVPVRLFVTNNFHLACASVTAGRKMQDIQRDDSAMVDFRLLDPDDRGTEPSRQFYERKLWVDAFTLFDARAMLMCLARRHEVRR